MEKLHEQFIFYQLLVTEDIVQAVREEHALTDDDTHRIDDLWSYLATLKMFGTNDKELDLLVKVARCIMTIPHSNAYEERIFSLTKLPAEVHFRLITHYHPCLSSKLT